MAALDEVLVGREWEKRHAPDVDTIRRSFSQSTERVLIVNYKFFETILLKLEKALMEDIATEKVYAKIEDEKNEFSLIKH